MKCRLESEGAVMRRADESVVRDAGHLADLCNLARKKAHDYCDMVQWSVPERDVAEGELGGIAFVLERALEACSALIGRAGA